MKGATALGLVVLLTWGCGETPPGQPMISELTAMTARDLAPARSPDGTRIAFWRAGANGFDLWVADADMGNGRPLPASSLIGAQQPPIWSADSRELLIGASMRSISDIVLVSVDDGTVTYLSENPAFEIPVQFHPDGDRIVFGAFGAGGSARTYTVSRSSGEIRPFPDVEGSVVLGAVSPDGAHIAYFEGSGGLSTMWVRSADGGERHQVSTDGFEFFSRSPGTAWSPDSREFLFTSTRSGRPDLFIGNVDGSARQLTTDINDDDFPVWSPDGKWVAFRSNRGRQGDVWIVPAAGGDAIRVTNTVEQEDQVSWTSPTTIEFTVVRAPGKLWRRNLVDGSEERITADSISVINYWLSPDRQRLALQIERPGGNDDLALLDLTSGEPRIISRGSRHQVLRWSPDATQIAFTALTSGSIDVYLANATGDPQVRALTKWPSFEIPIGWSADGATIEVVSDNASKLGDLWRFPVSGQEGVRVTTLGTVLDGRTFTHDGTTRTLLLVTDSLTGEIELNELLPSGRYRKLTSGTPNLPFASADGEYLAFDVLVAGVATGVIYRQDGSLVRQLDPGGLSRSFSPDGTQLLYTSRAAGNFNLHVLDIASGRSSAVTTTPEDEVDANYLDDASVVLRREVATSQLIRADVTSLLNRP